MQTLQARRLTNQEKEKVWIKKLIAAANLEKAMLKHLAEGICSA